MKKNILIAIAWIFVMSACNNPKMQHADCNSEECSCESECGCSQNCKCKNK